MTSETTTQVLESSKLKPKISARIAKEGTIATIDFSDFLSGDEKRVQHCLKALREACMSHGFFQLINHGISLDTQKNILAASREFFALPQEEKSKLDQSQNKHNRGYQMLCTQTYKPEDTKPDLKEGFYVGPDLPWDHPEVVAKQFAKGPNYWPESLGKPFQDICMDYLSQCNILNNQILHAAILALGDASSSDEDFMERFTQQPICYFKFNHYPKPPDMTDIGQKGHGEHKDFGFITLLLQDGNPGLEIIDEATGDWIQVPPMEGAFTVNIGNLLQRWTNDKYVSNTHRVLNHSGEDRYTIAHLFHGNPDYVVSSRESCKDPIVGAKYPPVKIDDWVRGKYADVYKRAGVYDEVVG